MENCQISFPRFGGVILVLFAFFFPAQPQRTHLLKISFFLHFPAEHHTKKNSRQQKRKWKRSRSKAKQKATKHSKPEQIEKFFRALTPHLASIIHVSVPRGVVLLRGSESAIMSCGSTRPPPPPQTCLKRFNGGEGSCCHPQDVI